ncbi:hypothetical protein [Desulfosediminicola flagellatus]|uniref:hypothetical protein n=1 Tax=Desulfosediminicola flagellatus TaxID=2569541 RepID=UPI0010AC9EB9|nr:hypothetical protein [Desulfosediminicola flagellatus]
MMKIAYSRWNKLWGSVFDLIVILCVYVSGGGALATEDDFLEIDLTELIQVTIISVATKSQQLSDASAAE